jgi:hypothetical protein
VLSSLLEGLFFCVFWRVACGRLRELGLSKPEDEDDEDDSSELDASVWCSTLAWSFLVSASRRATSLKPYSRPCVHRILVQKLMMSCCLQAIWLWEP